MTTISMNNDINALLADVRAVWEEADAKAAMIRDEASDRTKRMIEILTGEGEYLADLI